MTIKSFFTLNCTNMTSESFQNVSQFLKLLNKLLLGSQNMQFCLKGVVQKFFQIKLMVFWMNGWADGWFINGWLNG